MTTAPLTATDLEVRTVVNGSSLPWGPINHPGGISEAVAAILTRTPWVQTVSLDDGDDVRVEYRRA